MGGCFKDRHTDGQLDRQTEKKLSLCVSLLALFSFQTLVESNVILSEVQRYCYSPNQGYWIASLYVYKGLLLAFGTFLAWETRHVTIPALNDSKNIGACIYNVVVVCVFGVPLAHVLPTEQATVLFVLESCLIIFCTAVCQCIIFVPKVILHVYSR